jgi:hypothetical protein
LSRQHQSAQTESVVDTVSTVDRQQVIHSQQEAEEQVIDTDSSRQRSKLYIGSAVGRGASYA